MVEEAEVTRKAGMKKHTTRSTEREWNSTSVVKRDTQFPIAKSLKNIKTMMTRSQILPVVDRE